MTPLDATVEIAKILAKFWYNTDTPALGHPHEVYRLVIKVTRGPLGYTEDGYDRAMLERDATKVLCEHYEV